MPHHPDQDPPSVDQELTELRAKIALCDDEIQRMRGQLASSAARERNLRSELEAARRQPADQSATPSGSSGAVPDGTPAGFVVATGSVADDVVELDDARVLQQVGIYEYHHPLESADAYKERLADLRSRIKERVKSRDAIETSPRFVYNNSLAQGRKMTSDLSKLMLLAYNAEVDNCLRTMRAGNVQTAKARLERTVNNIAKLGSMMDMRIASDFHALRLAELELTADYLIKVQEEREEAREERARLREQRKVEQELRAERERLDKERAHYATLLATLQAQGREQEASDALGRLAEIDEAIESTDYRIANQRAGYVYVISNLGAFGPGVVKIGLTRRLEPQERVAELGGASVPFPFDVHAIYFSDDAVTLENELHRHFASRRVNLVNLRREFFYVTPAQVRDVLASKLGNLLEFAETPEAAQFHQSQGARSLSPA